MIVSLASIEKTLLELATDEVRNDPVLDYRSLASVRMIAEKVWATIHEIAKEKEVRCPRCGEGTLRPCTVIIRNVQELAIGCDECKYTETAAE